MKAEIKFNGYITVEDFMTFFERTIRSTLSKIYASPDDTYHVEDLAVYASIAAENFLNTIESIPWEVKKTK